MSLQQRHKRPLISKGLNLLFAYLREVLTYLLALGQLLSSYTVYAADTLGPPASAGGESRASRVKTDSVPLSTAELVKEKLNDYRNLKGREKAWALYHLFELLKLGSPWETRKRLRSKETERTETEVPVQQEEDGGLSLLLPNDFRDMVRSYPELHSEFDLLSHYPIEDLILRKPELADEELVEETIGNLKPGSRSYFIAWELISSLAFAIPERRKQIQQVVYDYLDSKDDYSRSRAAESFYDMVQDGTIALDITEQTNLIRRLKEMVRGDKYDSDNALSAMYQLMCFNPSQFYSGENVAFIEGQLYHQADGGNLLSSVWFKIYHKHLDWIAKHGYDWVKVGGSGSTFLSTELGGRGWEKMTDYLLDYMYKRGGHGPAVELLVRLLSLDISLRTDSRMDKLLAPHLQLGVAGYYTAIEGFLSMVRLDPEILKLRWLSRLVSSFAKSASGDWHFSERFGNYLLEYLQPLLDDERITREADRKVLEDVKDMVALAQRLKKSPLDPDLLDEVISIFKSRWGINIETGFTTEEEEEIFVFLGGEESKEASPGQTARKRWDPYEILGVSRGASQKEIKSAYRRLSVRHHPDKNPDDPEAAERFREICRAYKTLEVRKRTPDLEKDL